VPVFIAVASGQLYLEKFNKKNEILCALKLGASV
jgi:hypothetical protein